MMFVDWRAPNCHSLNELNASFRVSPHRIVLLCCKSQLAVEVLFVPRLVPDLRSANTTHSTRSVVPAVAR